MISYILLSLYIISIIGFIAICIPFVIYQFHARTNGTIRLLKRMSNWIRTYLPLAIRIIIFKLTMIIVYPFVIVFGNSIDRKLVKHEIGLPYTQYQTNINKLTEQFRR